MKLAHRAGVNTAVNELKSNGNLYAQYPPQAMTAGSTTILGLTYSASASSSAPESAAWEAFGNELTEQWSSQMTDPLPYANVAGTTAANVPVSYQGTASTTVSGVVYNGEWLQMLMPLPVYADKVVVKSAETNFDAANVNSEIIASAVLAGSSNGVQWSLISEHLDLPPDLDFTHTREFTTGVTAAYTYIRLIIPTIYNSALVSISRFQILQANRAVQVSADVAKVKNVIGFDDASTELQNGTGCTTLLARIAAVELLGGGGGGGADLTGVSTEVLQLKNALGMNNREPI
jgi:hypothetical protein